jgi:uncharacterized protein (TIRG00374 family)
VKSKILKEILFWGISLACLYFSFKQINLNEVFQLIIHSNYLYILLAILFTFGQFLVRAYRWSMMFPESNQSYKSFYSATHIGYFFNNVLPFRAGELIKAKLVIDGKNNNAQLSYSLGTVLSEKILDTLILSVSILAFVLIGFMGFLNTKLIVLNIFLVLLALLLIFSQLTFLDKIKNRFPKFDEFMEGISIISHYKFTLVFLSIIFWLNVPLYTYYAMLSLGVAMNFEQTIVLTILSTIGIAIPLAPGAIGTFHLAVIYCLNTIYNYDLSTAQSAAIMLHGINFLYIVLVGFWYFYQEKKEITYAH